MRRIRGAGLRRRLRGGAQRAADRFGLYDWDASTVFGTASGQGVAGSAATGLSVVMLVYLRSLPGALMRMCERTLTTAGYVIRSNSTTLQIIVGNGTTTATAPTRTWVAGDVGRLHMVGFSHDLTTLRGLVNRAEVGSGSPLAGYAAAARSMVLGSSDGGGNPATAFTILGVCGRDSPLSVPNFQTICDATKRAGQLELGGISMDHLWRMPRQATVPTTWANQIGAPTMGFVQGSAANLLVQRIAGPGAWGY